MTTLLVLGHKGMLGNAIIKYFSQYPEKYSLLSVDERWGEPEFNNKLLSTNADFIINCIGSIPQKHAQEPAKYKELNIDLPVFLESLGRPIIHPSTDSEFLGDLPLGQKYKKNSIRDATNEYGRSKAFISEEIEKKFKNTKMLRVSIIGHELSDKKFSLLEWVLSSKGQIKGYTNHYWNGVTTLEWAKICDKVIKNWKTQPVLNQYGTEKIINKYDLVKLIAKVYNYNDIIVEPFTTGQDVNKCLESDMILPPIDEQLEELKKFYNK